jgi:hypothetical protein
VVAVVLVVQIVEALRLAVLLELVVEALLYRGLLLLVRLTA